MAEGHGADNCEDNPNCLLGLGEGGEGVWAECPPTIEELGNDPHAQVKQPDVPAGLEVPLLHQHRWLFHCRRPLLLIS